MGHIFVNNKNIVPIGHIIKAIKNASSNNKSIINKTISVIITIDFTNIPIPIENPTNPFLYSLFHGLKKVLIKSGRENNCKKALFSDPKKPKMPMGASRYQNLRNAIGSVK
jgi:hypothetical protein